MGAISFIALLIVTGMAILAFLITHVLGGDREIAILVWIGGSTLAQHPGQTFSRAQLLDRLHGIAYDGYDRSIDAHIKNLRHKLEIIPTEPRYILTVYGVGYKFADEREG